MCVCESVLCLSVLFACTYTHTHTHTHTHTLIFFFIRLRVLKDVSSNDVNAEGFPWKVDSTPEIEVNSAGTSPSVRLSLTVYKSAARGTSLKRFKCVVKLPFPPADIQTFILNCKLRSGFMGSKGKGWDRNVQELNVNFIEDDYKEIRYVEIVMLRVTEFFQFLRCIFVVVKNLQEIGPHA